MSYFILQLLTSTCLALCSELQLTSAHKFPAEPARIDVRSLSNDPGMCPLAETVEMVRSEIREDTRDVIHELVTDLARPCNGPEYGDM